MIIPDHIQQAIQSYYAERATPEEIASLESWFREDIEHIRIFAQHGMLEWQMLCEVEKADAAAIMTILREVEAKAKPDFSLLRASVPEMAPIEPDETPVTLRDLWYVAGYLAVKGLRSKTAIIGSIAAVLVFGAVLYVSILGLGSAPKPFDVASDPNRPAPIVATLTAEHNAAWERRPGEDLYAGQRLTLTQGFAEITTNDGAIAILEAPATIELLDNDNALRLHTGKMVGICETKSSKGFVVRTSHIDVTDMGTQFGVDANTAATEVHVFQGEVQARRPDAPVDTEPTTLTTNQSARASIDTDVITPIDSSIDRFASLLPEKLQLLNTGQGLALGEIDPAWTIVEIDGQPLEAPLDMRVFDDPPTRQFGPADAKWIGIKSSEQNWKERQVLYTVHTQIEIPKTADADSASLLLRFHADDRMISLFVNGQRVDVPANHVMTDQINEIRITDYWAHGNNAIRLEITDQKPSHDQDNYVGIRANWQLITGRTSYEGGAPAHD